MIRARSQLTPSTRRSATSFRVWSSYGYIDRMGQLVIAPQFKLAEKFSDGLAAVKIGDKWGFIDKKGRFVVNPLYKTVKPFEGGLAWVELNSSSKNLPGITQDLMGYIDKLGRFVYGPVE